MKQVLFLCSQNKWRSPTAEAIFSDYAGIETDSAGINKGAEVQVSQEHIEWANIILVMEKKHKAQLNRQFGQLLKNKKISVLDIPDKYSYMDKKLITLLKKRCAPYFV